MIGKVAASCYQSQITLTPTNKCKDALRLRCPFLVLAGQAWCFLVRIFSSSGCVPLALILTILIQTAAGIWWAATISARVSFVETWIADNKTVMEQMARIETRQEYMMQAIERIDRKLEKKE